MTKLLILTKIYYGYQQGFASAVYNFFGVKHFGSVTKSEIMQNHCLLDLVRIAMFSNSTQKLAEKLRITQGNY